MFWVFPDPPSAGMCVASQLCQLVGGGLQYLHYRVKHTELRLCYRILVECAIIASFIQKAVFYFILWRLFTNDWVRDLSLHQYFGVALSNLVFTADFFFGLTTAYLSGASLFVSLRMACLRKKQPQPVPLSNSER